jgi:site-specific recombinase XerD
VNRAKRSISVLPRHIEAFRDLLIDSGRAPSSLRLDVKIISGIFALGVREGYIAKNPTADVELDNSAGQSREPFTAAEMKALLSTATVQWTTAVHCARRTPVSRRC